MSIGLALPATYRPPAPRATTPVAALIRAAFAGERDLLSLLPDLAYRELVTPLGVSRCSSTTLKQWPIS
jgi:hypothetical protein